MNLHVYSQRTHITSHCIGMLKTIQNHTPVWTLWHKHNLQRDGTRWLIPCASFCSQAITKFPACPPRVTISAKCLGQYNYMCWSTWECGRKRVEQKHGFMQKPIPVPARISDGDSRSHGFQWVFPFNQRSDERIDLLSWWRNDIPHHSAPGRETNKTTHTIRSKPKDCRTASCHTWRSLGSPEDFGCKNSMLLKRGDKVVWQVLPAATQVWWSSRVFPNFWSQVCSGDRLFFDRFPTGEVAHRAGPSSSFSHRMMLPKHSIKMGSHW